MTRHQKSPNPTIRNRAWQTAVKHLDEHLERNTTHSNAEIIRRLRQAAFADVDALEKSGRVIIPK